MIITKTPFRISFSGGGSDIKNFYENYGGCVLSTSINKYMYISIHPYFDSEFISLKYSANELVKNAKDIKHSIFNQVLRDMELKGIEITSTADVPGGTGLGSSSTFTVGLLNTLYSYIGKYVAKGRLAKEACEVEIDKLHSPIGKQDQYAAAFGGLNFIQFHQNDTVSVSPIIMKGETYTHLENNLILFYTGTTRNANVILSEQKKNISQAEKTKTLLQMCNLTKEMKNALEQNDLTSFGDFLDEEWKLKKTLAAGITNSDIDNAYDIAMKYGAKGGKLLGAGGGGFLLLYCEKDKQPLLKEKLNMREFPFEFERDGTSLVYIGEKYWR